MTDAATSGLVDALHEAVRRAQAAGDHETARNALRAILKLDPGNLRAESLLDGSARHCQMTVMYCDLVGSTGLAERLDREDLSEVLRIYRTACAQVVERYGGFLEDREGDGLLMRFGPPTVHEDDPYRAVRAGLGIVEAMRDRAPAIARDFGVEPAVRIAVHTGMVLIDAGDLVGTTPNEAARLQALARPNEVLISDATWELVRRRFDVEPRGPSTLPGVSRAIETYAVLRERTTSPLESARWLTSFAGRRAERDGIASLWRQALDGGSPAAVLVVGGPGIGKSRLLVESARALGADGSLCQCSRYHTATSLHAFRPLLAKLCDVTEDDEPPLRLEKLRAVAGAQAGDLPLLAAALGIPAEITSPPVETDPTMLRERALEVAAGIVRSRMPRPAMLVVDDVQWADDSTLALISDLLSGERSRMLLAFGARDSFVAPWPDELVRRVDLQPLTGEDLAAMALEIPQSAALPEDKRRELVERSDGIPLYLEELARSTDALAWESRRPSSVQSHSEDIPAALRDPLLARLSAPGVDLELAQIAATIGRVVDRRLLQRVADLPDDVFGAKLANLRAVGVLDRPDERTVRFRHELIRALAYDTQRRAARRLRHSRIADLLPVVAVDIEDAGVAAFHLERAGRYDEAIDAYLAAAGADQALGAHKEATQRLTHALELLEGLAEGPERLLAELRVRQLRAFSAVMADGYSTRECQEDHARCVELCELLGLAPQLLPSLMANWSYYCSCDLAKADRVRETAELLVDRGGLEIPLRDMGLGVTGFFAGRFAEARDRLLAFLDHGWGQTPGAPPEGWVLPNDPFAGGCAHLAAALWMAGEPERAREVAERGLERAAGLPYPYGPFSSAYVQSQLALIDRLEGDGEAAGERGEKMAELGRRHGFDLFRCAGRIQQYLSGVYARDPDALDVVAAEVAQWQAIRASEVWCPYMLAELAAAQGFAGRRKQAYESLDRALVYARKTGAHFYTAEVLRIRGRLRREEGDPRGLGDLEKALATARRQGSPALAARVEESLQAAHALSAP